MTNVSAQPSDNVIPEARSYPALAIGVTGHRALTDVDRLAAGIDEAAATIAQRFPSHSMQVLSSLAEGADRLVARRLMARHGARLIVPLPLPRAQYLQDFPTPASRAEFEELIKHADRVVELPQAPAREDAYRQAGVYVIDHCDVLLAVWDGQDPRGAGGTGEIVQLARQRGLPIVWVHSSEGNRYADEPTNLEARRANVTYERLSDVAARN